MSQNTYEAVNSGHLLEVIDVTPITIHTLSDTDYFFAGTVVRDCAGKRFTVAEVKPLYGRLSKIVLIPEEEH